jgi:SAM-dependent methyltransferase
MNFRQLYNRLAGTYELRQSGPSTRVVRKKEAALLRRFASGRSLDIGCGTGFHLTMLDDAVGIDVSEGMLRLDRSGSPLVQAAAEELPFRDQSFSSVLCMFSVFNMCDHRRAVKEMWRVLEPGGTALISVGSIWDTGPCSLRHRKASVGDRDLRRKRFHVCGEKVELRMFSREELDSLFRDNGFATEFFDSLFILQGPRWGDHAPFSVKERVRLWMERFWPKEYGSFYFMAFRKREGQGKT